MSLLLFCFFVRQNVSQQFLNPKRSLVSEPLTAPPPPMVTIPCHVPSQGCASECSFHPEEGYSSYRTTWCWTDQAHRFWKDCDCHAPAQGGPGDLCNMWSTSPCLPGLNCLQALGRIGDWGNCGVPDPAVNCPIIDGCSPGFTIGSVNGCPACVPAPCEDTDHPQIRSHCLQNANTSSCNNQFFRVNCDKSCGRCGQGVPGAICDMWRSDSPCRHGYECIQTNGLEGNYGTCGNRSNCEVVDGCTYGSAVDEKGCTVCLLGPGAICDLRDVISCLDGYYCNHTHGTFGGHCDEIRIVIQH
jgi:hypothetical protein